MKTLTITQPDDWHCHLREDSYLATTVADTARTFRRAIVMPNLKNPVTTVEQARHYREQICQHIPQGCTFTPLMTLYLSDTTTSADIKAAKASGFIYGVKLYPAGVTTHSSQGVTQLQSLYPVLETMADNDLPLLIHGESRDTKIDVFDRERIFIETELNRLTQTLPELRMVLEHISTQEAVAFVTQSGPNVAATITPHHLCYNRNDMLGHGIKPHLFCLPILKKQPHQQAVLQAATSGNPKFFLGTDSAPHSIKQKESSCGCAGIYSAPYALAIYAEIFERANKLDRLENFASHFGAKFYKLEPNQSTLTLIRQAQSVPTILPFAADEVVPMAAGTELAWSIL